MRKRVFAAILVLLVSSGVAIAALTVTNTYIRPQRLGRTVTMMTGTIAFDTSYAYGGESASDISKWFSTISSLELAPVGGYTFEYDSTNDKIKVFQQAPPIVYEEKHTIASNAITLDYPAAAIINVCSATQHQHMVGPDSTLAANEVKLTAAMAANTRTGLTFHASTSGVVFVTYITQAWKDVWDNRVAEESATVASHVAKFDYVACFVESITTTGTDVKNYYQIVRGGDAADTVDEAEIDFTDSGNSNLWTATFHADAAVTACTATYIKVPSSGFLADRFLEDQDTTMSSGASGALTPAHAILFQSVNGCIPDYTAANERNPHYLQMCEADALGTGGEFAIRYGVRPATGITGHIKTNDSTSDAVSFTYVWGVPEEIPGVVPLEVKNATDLSGLTAVRYVALGY